MTPPPSRRLLRIAGWLLTPFVAWAVSFLGAWIGAAAGSRVSGGTGALFWLSGGGIAGAVAGVIGWALLMRRTSRASGGDA